MLALCGKREAFLVAYARGEALPFDNATFDLAFSVDVIHHVAARADFYREAWRVPAGWPARSRSRRG